MKMCLFGAPASQLRTHLSLTLTLLALLCVSGASSVYAQQHISKRYPTGKTVKLVLKNVSGTITVESWDRNEIKVSATLESPSAHFSPRQTDDGLSIDLMSENRGRGDIGAVNFNIQVPTNTSVDVQTIRGDIHVSNIHGVLVRAHVSSEGDIDLTGVSANEVTASNTTGNIFFDGEFANAGRYDFSSTKGEIQIRIPSNSAFQLVALTPSRKIQLGPFWNNQMQSSGGGRKYEGVVGNGGAKVTVTNSSGSITFLRR
jgi:DUF4097 and DUF4098 domain-containing protein YvlB